MVRACRPPAREPGVLAGAPLDDRHVDARQRQLARQHQPRRASPGNHHRMLVTTAAPSLGLCSGRRFCGTTGALPQAPQFAIPWSGRERRAPFPFSCAARQSSGIARRSPTGRSVSGKASEPAPTHHSITS